MLPSIATFLTGTLILSCFGFCTGNYGEECGPNEWPVPCVDHCNLCAAAEPCDPGPCYEGCDCLPGFSRDYEGACVPYAQCQQDDLFQGRRKGTENIYKNDYGILPKPPVYSPPEQFPYGPPESPVYNPPEPTFYSPPKPNIYSPPKPSIYGRPKLPIYRPAKPPVYSPPKLPIYSAPKPSPYNPPKLPVYGPPKLPLYNPPPPSIYNPPPPSIYNPPPPSLYNPPPSVYGPSKIEKRSSGGLGGGLPVGGLPSAGSGGGLLGGGLLGGLLNSAGCPDASLCRAACARRGFNRGICLGPDNINCNCFSRVMQG